MFAFDSKVDVIFEDGIHYVSFSRINDLMNKIYLIRKSKGDSEYQKIANSAREFVEKKHTWKNRVEFFLDDVLKL